MNEASREPGVLLPWADTQDVVLGSGPHLGHPEGSGLGSVTLGGGRPSLGRF